MITWVTVWVLTVQSATGSPSNTVYQMTFASQSVCEKQIAKHTKNKWAEARCDFQQIPMVTK